jgi:transposase
MCRIEKGSLPSTLGGYEATQPLQKDFPFMNIIAPDLYRALRRRIERRKRKSQSVIEVTRCRILLLLDEGLAPTEVAQHLECDRSLVYKTVYRFDDHGEEGLADRRRLSMPRKVTPELLNRLLVLLEESPRDLGWERSTWTLELLALEIEKEFGVKLSPSHIRALLRDMGCRRGRPRPGLRIPVRGRRRILAQIRRWVRRSSREQEVFYIDEADVELNPRLGACYTRKGRQWVVQTPGKNQKRYLAGALNARTGRIIHTESLRKNSSLFLALLERLSATYRRAEKLHLILDNYIIHKSRQTLKGMAQFGARIVLHFLPPYSPEHNVIERLWKQMHDQVTRNHQHPTLDSLMAAIFRFLESVQPFPGTKVSTLPLAA